MGMRLRSHSFNAVILTGISVSRLPTVVQLFAVVAAL